MVARRGKLTQRLAVSSKYMKDILGNRSRPFNWLFNIQLPGRGRERRRTGRRFVTNGLIWTSALLLLGFAPALCARESFPEFSALPAQAALPDPLVMLDGRKARSPAEWFGERRP